jgi:hypothetical protein
MTGRELIFYPEIKNCASGSLMAPRRQPGFEPPQDFRHPVLDVNSLRWIKPEGDGVASAVAAGSDAAGGRGRGGCLRGCGGGGDADAFRSSISSSTTRR